MNPMDRYEELQNSDGDFIGDEAWFEAKGIKETHKWFLDIINSSCCGECLLTLLKKINDNEQRDVKGGEG